MKSNSKQEDIQRHFDSVLESAIDGIIVIDSMGIIHVANNAVVKLFQYEKDEMVGQNVSMLMSNPHKSAHNGYLQNYLNTGHAKIIGIGREVSGLKKDGTSFPFRLAVGEVKLQEGIFFTGFVHDLTIEKEAQKKLQEYASLMERKVYDRTAELQQINDKLEAEIETKERAQVAMLESQKLYEAIAINFPNGTINVLDRDLNFLFVEGSGLKEIGYGTKDLIGKCYLNLIDPQIKDKIETQLKTVFDDESVNFEIEINNLVFRVRAVPLPNERNEIDRILLVESNITQQKKAEEEIYNSLKKEKELSELKSRFVSMASHEFRTPLSTILSSASLIERYTSQAEQEKRAKHTERIKGNVRNLTMILNDFLSLEKLEEDQIKTSDDQIELVTFANEIVEELGSIRKAGQSITVVAPFQELVITSDKFILQNVLINLLSNAIKYSGNSSEIQLVLSVSNQSTQISVVDNGRGINEDDQKRLFTRFFRASNAGNEQGTGLGLHIVKRYMELLKGNIQFKSALEKGSTFVIELPNER